MALFKNQERFKHESVQWYVEYFELEHTSIVCVTIL